MIIGFTGHRDKLAKEVDILAIEQIYPGAIWVHGGAPGFDSQVHQIGLRLGKVKGTTLLVIRPDYKTYPVKIAPLKRNEVIVDMADVMVALFDGRPKGGTKQAVRYAEETGVPVRFVSEEAA